jgi:ubiquinone/menaquinone biosynthesis C-methylase UbiE
MAEIWDDVADGWEQNAERIDAHLAAATTALLDAARLGPGDAVLELACGPGSVGIGAAERVGEGGRVVLADVAPQMVAVAARRATGLPQLVTRVFGLEAIDAPDASFDAVLSRHGLMFATDPAAAVRETARVLRPGGRHVAMVWAARAENPWLGLVFDAVAAQFGLPSFPPPGLPGPFALDDPGTLGAALRDGGLVDVTVERLEAPFAVASVETWWTFVAQIAGPLVGALAGLEADVREEIRQRALAAGAGAARTTADGIVLDGAVLLAAGTR